MTFFRFRVLSILLFSFHAILLALIAADERAFPHFTSQNSVGDLRRNELRRTTAIAFTP